MKKANLEPKGDGAGAKIPQKKKIQNPKKFTQSLRKQWDLEEKEFAAGLGIAERTTGAKVNCFQFFPRSKRSDGRNFFLNFRHQMIIQY